MGKKKGKKQDTQKATEATPASGGVRPAAEVAPVRAGGTARVVEGGGGEARGAEGGSGAGSFAERGGRGGGEFRGGRGGGEFRGGGRGGGEYQGGRGGGEFRGARGGGEFRGGRGGGEFRGGGRGGGEFRGARGGGEFRGGRGGGEFRGGGRGGGEYQGGRGGGEFRGGRGGGEFRGGRGGGEFRGGGRGGGEFRGARGGGEFRGGRGGGEFRGGGRGGGEYQGGRGGGEFRGGRGGGEFRGGGRGGGEYQGGRGGGEFRGGRGGGEYQGGGRGGGEFQRGGIGAGRGQAHLTGSPVSQASSSPPATAAVLPTSPIVSPPHIPSPPPCTAAAESAPQSPTGSTVAASAASATSSRPKTKSKREDMDQLKKDIVGMVESSPSEKFRARQFKLKPPKKKAQTPGTLGRPIRLLTNHFDLNFKCRSVFHYDVELTPRASKAIKRLVFDLAIKESTEYRQFYPVYDGEKNMYTARQLPLRPGQSATLTVPFAPEGEPHRDYSLVVKPAQPCEVELEPLLRYATAGTSLQVPQASILALDIVLRHLPSLRFTPVGRSFFPEQGPRVHDIGGGCELWIGYYSSIRVGWKQPRINIDVSNKAFHKPLAVMDKMAAILGQRFNPARGLDSWQHKDVEKQMRNLKVEYQRGQTGGKRRYRVNGLSRGSARESMFDNEGVQISVEAYFRNTLNITLRFPLLPCLWVGSRNKRIYIPSEICTIVKGQVNTNKLDPDQVSAMIKETAVPADRRLERIKGFVRDANFNQDPYNKAFQLQVSDRPTEVSGRILPPPTLKYGSGKAEPRDGVWRTQRFLDAKDLKVWAVLDYGNVYDDRMQAFINVLYERGRECGMSIEFPKGTLKRDGRVPDNVDAVADLQKVRSLYGKELQLVVVVLPAKGKLYGIVKHAGDVTVGQMTACVLSKNVMKADRNTAQNICLKWNAKLGGTNNALEAVSRPRFLEEPTIIFGADVTHPAPDQFNKPSIAAVVATMDRSYHARYSQRVLVQFPPVGTRAMEMIIDMKSAVAELLKEFHKLNRGTKPQRIIFFRDGVSEGQFEQVMAYELEQIKEACRSLQADYQPNITFLVVQKRHHTRLFAQDMRDTCGRSKNVPPGTVVDSVIAHPTELDYFLVSHQGIQGTSRPTHYHLLHDDSQLTADQLQLLTYYMCHLFARCTRSVSNPAPSYYAHHVAYRARMHHDNYLRLSQLPDDRPAPQGASVDACQPQFIKEMYYV